MSHLLYVKYQLLNYLFSISDNIAFIVMFDSTASMHSLLSAGYVQEVKESAS